MRASSSSPTDRSRVRPRPAWCHGTGPAWPGSLPRRPVVFDTPAGATARVDVSIPSRAPIKLRAYRATGHAICRRSVHADRVNAGGEWSPTWMPRLRRAVVHADGRAAARRLKSRARSKATTSAGGVHRHRTRAASTCGAPRYADGVIERCPAALDRRARRRPVRYGRSRWTRPCTGACSVRRSTRRNALVDGENGLAFEVKSRVRCGRPAITNSLHDEIRRVSRGYG